MVDLNANSQFLVVLATTFSTVSHGQYNAGCILNILMSKTIVPKTPMVSMRRVQQNMESGR